LVHYDSFHELGKEEEEEKLYNIFPLLKNQKWLEWIDWDKYSELSKNIKQSVSHKEITDYQNVKLPLSSKGFIFSNLIPYNTNKIESKKYFIKENKEFLKELYKFSKDLKPNIK